MSIALTQMPAREGGGGDVVNQNFAFGVPNPSSAKPDVAVPPHPPAYDDTELLRLIGLFADEAVRLVSACDK
jgi:hypothetical protein